MAEHLFFSSYLLLYVTSVFGYGFIFSNVFEKDFLKLNLGYIGIIGIFLSTFVSAVTSYFFPHNYLHNTIFHLIGFISFCFFFNRFVKKEILLCSGLIIIMISGIFVFKNHDDFPYYHLTYALNLSENSFLIGSGLFGHGFRTPSSIFYYHSLLYMPGIKYFLFHTGPFFILYFFNIIILSDISKKIEKKEYNFIYFLSLLSFIFINIIFYRIAEHGTDRSSQILLIIIFLLFFEILYFKNKKENKYICLFLLILTYAASIKVLYYIYGILIIFLFYEKKLNINFFLKKYSFILLLALFSTAFVSKSFFSTGCLVYPAEKTCFENFEWSIPKSSVKKMSIHYEWWAKAGGGPNYKHELSKEEYIKNFNWIQNWFEKHFVGKITDTLGAIFLISIIVLLLFKGSNTLNINIKRRNFKIYYLIPFIFMVEWFLNHPSMRYGGFVLFALPVFIILSHYLEKNIIKDSKIYIKSMLLILITLIIYNTRNIDRINNEIEKYNYDLLSSPYFYVPNVKQEVITSSKGLTIFRPINDMCWASKTPCSYNSNIDIKKYYWMNMIYLND
ncbi:MAG: hypothetical protein CBB97_06575 [Candidatus Endolissoclinum sp. TMED37]|nr:MAG: hypothetical protein CBB97_06575 [Candidatus Endolissoclinum sp. TMED37]